MVLLFYATYISVDIARYEIVHAKVGKGGILGNDRCFVIALLTCGK